MSTFNLYEQVKISNADQVYYVDLVTAVRIFLMQENSYPTPLEAKYGSILGFNARLSDEAERILLDLSDQEGWVRQFAVRRDYSFERPRTMPPTPWKIDLKEEALTNIYKILEQWEKERPRQSYE